MMIFKILIIAVVLAIFAGCSQVIALGHEQGYCEENGYDYADAGVCAGPMYVYKNRKHINTEVISCKKK